MLLAIGWVWSGAVRLRELRRVQAAARDRVLRAAAAGGGQAGAAAQTPQLPPTLPLPPAPQLQPGQLNRRGSHGSLAAQQHPWTAGDGLDLMSAAAASAPAAVSAAASAAADGREQRPAAWPAVAVVLPVKGRRANSNEAWASQLAMRYGEPGCRVHPAVLNPKLYPEGRPDVEAPPCPRQLAAAGTLCRARQPTEPCALRHSDGPLELLFVADDAADPACAALHSLFAQHEGVAARIVVAPHARRSSQKIRK